MESKTLLGKRIKVAAAFMAVLLAFFAMVSSSYAWLAISRTPIVSELDLTVLTESRLEIARDESGRPGDWDVVLDLSSILEDVVPLRPVAFLQEDHSLNAPTFGVDGRPTDRTMPLTDEQNANVKGIGDPEAEGLGYYITTTFWVRGPQNATVSLSPAVEIEEGRAGHGTFVIGNPVWDEEELQHENGGRGLETSVRIGFICQSTDMSGTPIGQPRYIMYEPNCDTHADGSTGYVETINVKGSSLIRPDSLIRQTTSTWDEQAPVLQDEVVYSLGEFLDDPYLFDVTTVTMAKVTMYLWVEVTDVDCVNAVMAQETDILACIQLTAEGGYHDTGIGRD